MLNLLRLLQTTLNLQLIGAGYIGAELAEQFAVTGKKVTLLMA